MIDYSRSCAGGKKALNKTQIWYLEELDNNWDCLSPEDSYKEMQDFIDECNHYDLDMARVWDRMTEDDQAEVHNIFEKDKWDLPSGPEDFI